MRGSTVIASVGTFVQAQNVAVVPVVHAIAGGQPVAPGVAFVGRHEETEKLLATLAPNDGEKRRAADADPAAVEAGPVAAGAGSMVVDGDPVVVGEGPVVVSAVAGMGGVGKTALARFCAAEAVERGWFPGGAYVVDLQGYSPGGMVARDALFAPLLHHFGVPAETVPGEPAAQAAMYDQVLRLLASQGRRVLLVLDNASTAAQVDGLLPTSGDHRVVVTTRDTLALPGARRLDLDVLTVTDALELLDEALREHDPADERAAEAEAAALVGVCGLLPLAVRVAAGLLADEPETSCAELATELANTPTEGFAHGETRVAPVLAASIDRLAARDPQAVRLLKLLPLHPGPDISTEAVAALAGVSVVAARTSLRTLRQAHLIIPTERRWRLHDLIRRHLLDQDNEEGDAATRLLAYYATTADAADDHLRALPGQPVPDLFTGREQALVWFDAEHATLVAAVQWAASNDSTHTVLLAFALCVYQEWRRHFNDLLVVNRTALDVCRKSGDRRKEGLAWDNLGSALEEMHQLDEAINAHEHARDIFQEIGDRCGEGNAWNNLGIALQRTHQLDKAVAAHERARDIFQEIGDRKLEGNAWNNLGVALRNLQRFDEAAVANEHDLVICQDIGDRHGEGIAWNNLGLALRTLHRFDEAIAAHERARDIVQETGDRHGEGRTWDNLGLALLERERIDEARRCFNEAAAAFAETGDTEYAQEVQRRLELLDADDEATGS